MSVENKPYNKFIKKSVRQQKSPEKKEKNAIRARNVAKKRVKFDRKPISHCHATLINPIQGHYMGRLKNICRLNNPRYQIELNDFKNEYYTKDSNGFSIADILTDKFNHNIELILSTDSTKK